MLNPRRAIACLAVCVLFGIWSETAEAQLPWRGHYVRRDGLFHTERMRWGGGMTANGASFMNNLVAGAVAVAPSILGKEEPSREEPSREERSRDASWCADYAVQLQRANELLDRTASLVNYMPPVGGGGGGGGQAGDVGLPAAGKEFGTESPWKKRPGQ
jgi:hypothetical protein